MAAVCSKCGAAISPGVAFCSACGMPIAPAGPPPAYTPAGSVQTPPAAAYGQPPAAGYPGAPATSSSSAAKIILIVVAVMVGIGILGAGAMGFMAWRVAKSMKMNANGNGVTMSVGGSTIVAGEDVAADADLGVPIYSGAIREKGGVDMDSGSGSMVMAHFTTGDPASQVVDFYKSKMGPNAVVVSGHDATVINSGESDADHTMVTIGPGSGEDAGKTSIVIVRTKKK